MKSLLLILVVIFVFCGNTSADTKIKDVCKWHHERIIGWHENNILFRKRHLEVSDKSKYPNNNKKTLEKNLLKQKKLLNAIEKAQMQLQDLSKVYHYLECTRFESKFEKSRS